MIAVLDTNVVASGAFFGGVPQHIMTAWHHGHFEIIVTPMIVEEYRRVLIELGLRFDVQVGHRMSESLMANSTLMPDRSESPSLCRDPDDDKFLACAADAKAVLVSGDKDLLTANGVLGVAVLTPRAFLSRLERRV